jgi:hypothetical protein
VDHRSIDASTPALLLGMLAFLTRTSLAGLCDQRLLDQPEHMLHIGFAIGKLRLVVKIIALPIVAQRAERDQGDLAGGEGAIPD